MASVKFAKNNRRGRMEYSYFAPLIINSDQPIWKVLPNNAVPVGKGGKDEQIGYWNEQPRWRMRKGQRVDVASKWHFYYLGTGPHSEEQYRKRIDGVYWVAVNGAKTSPTGLGTRSAKTKPLELKFNTKIPKEVEFVEPTSPGSSRANSRSQSRGGSKSRNNSPRRGNQSKSRNSSKNRGGDNRSRSSSGTRDQDAIVAAVKAALLGLGLGTDSNSGASGKASKANSGTSTPKPKPAATPKSPSTPKSQLERPEWKRVPDSDCSVEQCFGPRGGFKNFGSADFVQYGVAAKGYPQAAALTPTSAALLFGGNVQVQELSDDIEITYTYKMTVPKSDKNLEVFLSNVNAYKEAKPQREPKKKKDRSSRPPTPAPSAPVASGNAEPIYADVQPQGQTEPVYENPDQYLGGVDIVNEVYGNLPDNSQSTA
ncbi:nucleoprotein [Bat coronavirus CDPHE15/USA/2006]|uniref:Nucleoprotein n=1 Tax=Bat coronavirus CDPHE15 TaxID=1913643 RepID=S5YAG0_9ALPC|nr:nucleoprotein [Bat coronavirus CDPHE15/USA/2006]AGT21337.1 nucleoprotein [Bat coronavirus CDPHE15/USA/2006]